MQVQQAGLGKRYRNSARKARILSDETYRVGQVSVPVAPPYCQQEGGKVMKRKPNNALEPPLTKRHAVALSLDRTVTRGPTPYQALPNTPQVEGITADQVAQAKVPITRLGQCPSAYRRVPLGLLSDNVYGNQGQSKLEILLQNP
jgi:hypothetical protein